VHRGTKFVRNEFFDGGALLNALARVKTWRPRLHTQEFRAIGRQKLAEIRQNYLAAAMIELRN